jgi:hypothetical protein
VLALVGSSKPSSTVRVTQVTCHPGRTSSQLRPCLGFRYTHGIRPPDRRRAKQALSLSEREEISRWLSMRRSLRSIARHLGRSASTISREVHRNGGSDCYRAARSDQAAWDRARRPKLCRLAGLPSVPEADSIDLAGGNGHRSKLPVGSSAHIRGSLKSRCHTRRSIAACSFRPVAC